MTKGVWFVRSHHKTGSDLSKWLGFPATQQGIVVSTKNFSGYAASSLVEKLNVWESEDG